MCQNLPNNFGAFYFLSTPCAIYLRHFIFPVFYHPRNKCEKSEKGRPHIPSKAQVQCILSLTWDKHCWKKEFQAVPLWVMTEYKLHLNVSHKYHVNYSEIYRDAYQYGMLWIFLLKSKTDTSKYSIQISSVLKH